jgi:arylsulfatase
LACSPATRPHLRSSARSRRRTPVRRNGRRLPKGRRPQLLKKLDDLGIADSTIVLYSTDNGAETFTWPDGGTTPFRSEKNTNWEGG